MIQHFCAEVIGLRPSHFLLRELVTIGQQWEPSSFIQLCCLGTTFGLR